jgi:hypothetical protein
LSGKNGRTSRERESIEEAAGFRECIVESPTIVVPGYVFLADRQQQGVLIGRIAKFSR